MDACTPILLPPTLAVLGIARTRQVLDPSPQGVRTAAVLSLSLKVDHRGTDAIRAGQYFSTLVAALGRCAKNGTVPA